MLSHEELVSLVNNKPPLVEQMIDPYIQIQPNGIELTLQRIELHENSGLSHSIIQKGNCPGRRTLILTVKAGSICQKAATR